MTPLFNRLSGLLGSKKKPQHSLLVYIRLGDDEHGSTAEREDLFRLEDEVIAALEGANAGEFDGNEIGEGYFTLYMYGPSASRMWDVIAPVLVRFSAPTGSYAIQCFGDPGAEEHRIELATPAGQS